VLPPCPHLPLMGRERSEVPGVGRNKETGHRRTAGRMGRAMRALIRKSWAWWCGLWAEDFFTDREVDMHCWANKSEVLRRLSSHPY